MVVKKFKVRIALYHSTKKRQHSFHILKAKFASDTHQSMKTSDRGLKVNRNIFPDAVTCNRMRLTGPKCDHLGPINHAFSYSDECQTKKAFSI